MTHSELIMKTMGSNAPNMNHETGIHYGVIPFNSVSHFATDDIYTNGQNLSYESAIDGMKSDIAAIVGSQDDLETMSARLQTFCKASYVEYGDDIDDILATDGSTESKVTAIWALIEDDCNSMYTEDNDTYRYEQDGYIVETSDSDLFVIASPFYTLCGQCSPCAPNAGYLTSRGGNMKSYCLGAEWFDDEYSPLPYDVYSVATDELVAKRAENTDETETK